jgi:RNA polymerase sporulation-specific sigma factor
MSSLFVMLTDMMMFVSYIKNAFPQPLSEAEENRYLDLMAEGDKHARNMLIEHNLRLVAHIVKKFENTGENSEALKFIVQSISSTSSKSTRNKGTKLTTYARCIEIASSIQTK